MLQYSPVLSPQSTVVILNELGLMENYQKISKVLSRWREKRSRMWQLATAVTKIRSCFGKSMLIPSTWSAAKDFKNFVVRE